MGFVALALGSSSFVEQGERATRSRWVCRQEGAAESTAECRQQTVVSKLPAWHGGDRNSAGQLQGFRPVWAGYVRNFPARPLNLACLGTLAALSSPNFLEGQINSLAAAC